MTRYIGTHGPLRCIHMPMCSSIVYSNILVIQHLNTATSNMGRVGTNSTKLQDQTTIRQIFPIIVALQESKRNKTPSQSTIRVDCHPTPVIHSQRGKCR